MKIENLLKIRNCKLKILLLMAFVFLFFIPDTSAAVLQKPPANLGLVGYWSFNEGTTTIATDYSGNKNYGELKNGPAWSNGKLGKALSFDGSNDLVNAGSASSLDGSIFTISAWIYPKSLGELNSGMIVGKSSESLGWGFGVDTNNRIRFGVECANTFLEPTTYYVSPNNSLQLNQWNHVSITTNNPDSSAQLYIGGNAVTTTKTACDGDPVNNYDTSNLGIGNDTPTGKTFNGLIDEVRVYNRALSAAEVLNLYNSGR